MPTFVKLLVFVSRKTASVNVAFEYCVASVVGRGALYYIRCVVPFWSSGCHGHGVWLGWKKVASGDSAVTVQGEGVEIEKMGKITETGRPLST